MRETGGEGRLKLPNATVAALYHKPAHRCQVSGNNVLSNKHTLAHRMELIAERIGTTAARQKEGLSMRSIGTNTPGARQAFFAASGRTKVHSAAAAQRG